MEIDFIATKKFQKQAKKLIQANSKLKSKIDSCLIDFSKNLFLSKYYRKKLTGNKKDLHELQIGGDLRILVRIYFKEGKAYLVEIGTHSQLF